MGARQRSDVSLSGYVHSCRPYVHERIAKKCTGGLAYEAIVAAGGGHVERTDHLDKVLDTAKRRLMAATISWNIGSL